MAQLGARLDGIEEVVGSNPIGSTKSSKSFFRPGVRSEISYYLFILQSETSGRYYIGQTKDPEARLA